MTVDYDRHLAGYRRSTAEVWCETADCTNHDGPIVVELHTEYGQSWTVPEDCPSCGGYLTFEKPDREEDE